MPLLRDSRMLVVAAAALVALAVFAYRHAHRYDHLPAAFRTDTGKRAYDEYSKACRRNGTDKGCDCIFARITAAPPYDTPEGLASLNVLTMQNVLTGKGIPQVLLDAVSSCAYAG
jgi:hypothetical protein